MRCVIAISLVSSLLFGAISPAAQRPSPDAERASKFYKSGWDAFHREAWADAVKGFQQAIDLDPDFSLAYYSLGRAEMQLRNFAAAIAAYTKCRELYLVRGGDRFANQLDATRRLEDRLLEYRTALTQASQVSGPKAGTQSQNLLVRDLQTRIAQLEMARDRNINVTVDVTVPYFVSMALGTAYFRTGQFVAAEGEFKAAIDANPASGETLNNLAVLYMTTGRLEDAAKAITLAEQSGYKVNPEFKRDLEARRKR